MTSPLKSHLGRRLLAGFLAVSLAAITLITVAAAVGAGRGFDVMQQQSRQDAAHEVADLVATAYVKADGWTGIDLTQARQSAGFAGARLVVLPGAGSGSMGPGAMGRGAESATIVVAGQPIGTARLAFGSPTTSARDVAWTWIGVAALAAVRLAVIASWFAADRLVHPLAEVSGVARRFAAGDRSARVGDLGVGEVGELGRALDDMADEVERTDQSRRRATADAAHELRTPIASLQACLEELHDGFAEPDPETLARLHDQTLRLGRIVNDLAAISAAESGTLSLALDEVDLADVIRAEVLAQEPRARARRLQIRTSLSEVMVIGDADLLRQVIRNLVANAIRYCRPGVSIAVAAVSDHANAVVTVADTGPGITAPELTRVFDRLWRGTSSDRVQGSGIGLAVVHELVTAHHGTVRVDSDGHSGTTFTVTLPLRD